MCNTLAQRPYRISFRNFTAKHNKIIHNLNILLVKHSQLVRLCKPSTQGTSPVLDREKNLCSLNRLLSRNATRDTIPLESTFSVARAASPPYFLDSIPSDNSVKAKKRLSSDCVLVCVVLKAYTRQQVSNSFLVRTSFEEKGSTSR